MKKILLSCLIASTLTFFGACLAASLQPTNGYSNQLAGPYLGIQLGAGAMDTPDFPTSAKDAAIENNGRYNKETSWRFAGRLFGGYLWQIHKFQYGLELGGMMYPSNKYFIDIKPSVGPINYVDVDIKYKGYLVDLLAVLKYCFASKWNIYAKEGVAYTYQKVTAKVIDDNTITGITSETETSTDHKLFPEVAVGIGYHITSHAELNLSYHHVFANELSLDSDNARSKVASVDGVLLGLNWFFG